MFWYRLRQPERQFVESALRLMRILCATKASLIEPSQISEQAEFVAKLNGEEVSIPARIVFVSPELAISQDYKIMAEIENDGRLRAGLAGVLRLKKKSQ